jgi:hypothetical protein
MTLIDFLKDPLYPVTGRTDRIIIVQVEANERDVLVPEEEL